LDKLIEAAGDEGVFLLMPQEVRVSQQERGRVDAVFGGIVAFDYKSYEDEFDKASEKAVNSYLPHLPKPKYYVITNWDKWQVYAVRREGAIRLEMQYEGGRDGALTQLEGIIAAEVKEFKIPPFPQNIERLFSINMEGAVRSLKDVFNASRNNDQVKPLYESYKRIMKTLYSDASEDALEDLFVKHTLMHMIAMACLSKVLGASGDPVDLCSAALLPSEEGCLDVALPYLNWWKTTLHSLDEKPREEVEEICKEISVRASLLDWELGGEEDVFRRLYEVLVEPETRRKIGEYYTPLWLVDRVMSGFELNGKSVLDPFCGSGTFLVRSFYKKLELGQSPEGVYEELIGLDINPLAVAIARAELIIAYRKAAGKVPAYPPHIYHTDTLAAWFGGEGAFLEDPDYVGLLRNVEAYASAKASFEQKEQVAKELPGDVLRSLSKVERALALSIRLSMGDQQDLEGVLKRKILAMLDGGGLIERLFAEVVENTAFAAGLASLIKKYGNGVWATTITSALIPAILREFRPDIIVTNPPWVQTTKYKASYVSEMRKEMAKALQKIVADKKKAASVVTGSDIACAALSKALEFARESVGFVMNREQSFYSRGSERSGILATYAILTGWLNQSQEGWVELIDVNYDAFGHGVYPALVRAWRKKEGGTRVSLVELSVKGAVKKDSTLEDVVDKLKEEPLKSNYDEYVELLIDWRTMDKKDLAKALGVIKVVPKGAYIMGLFGGEKKRGKERYAGLVVTHYRCEKGIVSLRLHGLTAPCTVPKELMERYGVDIYGLYYRGLINPFKCRTYDVLLSSRGDPQLKEFLKKVIEFNPNMPLNDRRMLEKLIEELKTDLDVFEKGKHYVLYRRNRAFTACVPDSPDKAVSSDVVSYIVCPCREQAYYYAAVLNYLAYKVIKNERAFIRDQFTRPLMAIVAAGLSWKNVPESLRTEVAKLSEELSSKLVWKEYSKQERALAEVSETEEFKEIVRLLDAQTGGNSKLKKSLSYVSGKGRAKSEKENE